MIVLQHAEALILAVLKPQKTAIFAATGGSMVAQSGPPRVPSSWEAQDVLMFFVVLGAMH